MLTLPSCPLWLLDQLSLRLDEFPELIRRHKDKVPRTLNVEALAERFVASGFAEGDVLPFIMDVCRWGGYPGIAGRVKRDNQLADVSAALRAGYINARGGSAGDGLVAINKIKGLGISFASKHLRFLAPETAVTLDSFISERFGYALSVKGYERFINDCQSVLFEIRQASIEHPFNAVGGWRICDVEQAIFAKLRGF
jgi:hypothetical protein